METTPAPAPTTSAVNPQEVLQSILSGLGIAATIETQTRDGQPLLRVNTEDPSRLIGKHGQTLSHLQFLVNRILLRKDANAPRVTIDCENYRDRQHDDLLRKCSEAADKVRRWGDTVTLGPFTPAERRAIHQHFDTDRDVEALSETGDESARKKLSLRVRQSPLPAPGQARR